MRNTALFALAALAACASPTAPPAPAAAAADKEAALNITAAGNLPIENEAVAQLHRLLEQYDLNRWINTYDVVIQSRVVPHSHPVLTLNTRNLRNDDAALSVFVHEQGHWYFSTREAATLAAIDELGALFPETPASGEGGARDRQSTLLHLMVCMLEYDAMVELIGRDETRALLAANEIYPWVYARLLDDQDNARIRAVMAAHGLNTY